MIYINDLSANISSSFPVLFADDTNLFHHGKNLQDLTEVINEELKIILEWLQANKLSLNIKKTQYMIFKSNNKYTSDIPIIIDNVPIERVYSAKFLGVQIDPQLSWVKHIDYTCKKLSKCCGILSKAKRILNKSTLITLYYTFAYPYFTYCNIIWGNALPTHLLRLEKIQKKLIRMITSAPYKAHTAPLFLDTKILNIYQINEYMTSMFMYKYNHDLLPNVFKGMFLRGEDVHGYGTRQASALRAPFFKLKMTKSLICYQGPILWNEISKSIQSSTTILSFKAQYKRMLLIRTEVETQKLLKCQCWVCNRKPRCEENK